MKEWRTMCCLYSHAGTQVLVAGQGHDFQEDGFDQGLDEIDRTRSERFRLKPQARLGTSVAVDGKLLNGTIM